MQDTAALVSLEINDGASGKGGMRAFSSSTQEDTGVGLRDS